MNKRHLKKKRMLNFSFCFPYLAPLSSMVSPNFSKEKLVSNRRRYQSAKKKIDKKLADLSIFKSQKKKSSSQLEHTWKAPKRSQIEKQISNSVFELKQKLNNTLEVKNHAKPFSMSQVVQFNANQFVKRKTNIKKQVEKSKDIDNFSTLLTKDFEIPGVSFKKTEPKSLKYRYQTINHLQQQSHDFNDQQLIERNVSKNSNSKWNQQRLINIQFIIKSKCKDFQGIMAEYYQRTSNEKASFIFVFDSKDAWMKRVLLRRNWVQNTNKLSKAFHLIWSYKYPKQVNLFSEQLVNHYPKSIKLTTKAGLHGLLKQYNLSHLQPKTYDIDNEKDMFLVQFDKISFLRDLKEIILLFEFQLEPSLLQQAQLKNRLEQFLEMQMQNPEEDYFQRQIYSLLEKCFQFLQVNKKFKYRTSSLDTLKKIIQQKQKLQPLHIQIFSLFRDLLFYIQQSDKMQNLKEGGLNNIWIVKSQCSSKGAGMYLSNDLNTISKQGNRLVQKYIENVLILQEYKRKFDLRMWVLVVGGKNCRIYYNQQFYGRFCFQPYSLEEKLLKNSAVHLTNYTLNKNSYREGNTKAGSVLFPQELFTQVEKQYKVNYRQAFYGKIQGIVSQLYEVFKKQVCFDATESNFELFGVDLLIDYLLNIHLLQVNLSAQCEQRHQKLSMMLEQMGEGLLNILEGKEDTKKWRLIQ